MIVERLFPQKSKLFNKWRHPLSQFGTVLDAQGLIQLFTIWTLTVAGIVLQIGLVNRFVYWEWNGWLLGLIKLFLSTLLFYLFLHPKGLWFPGKKRLNKKEYASHFGLALLFLLIGWTNINNTLFDLVKLLPYLAAFLGGLAIFQFIIEFDKTKGVWVNFHWNSKQPILMSSVGLFCIAILLGFYFDDPIITSAGIVSVPFPLIALIWPSHVRHLQRARFYPLFIFAMFLCVRAPWFLIPLAILFYTLRIVNYFRYGIVYPSFGVDFSDNI